ncbi:hypothetical protein Hc94105_1767 [Helicobacter cinaedi]|uniref:hypothetical protein n=1 Tax=Helicobacter cinaedi TaxID=213 RepID=UPI001F377181|nr:hypothetical protein [Helicobacter cinaedi]BDB67544.1 hypothetical protein Hc94105_1767 [Helicobacter cinaedi]
MSKKYRILGLGIVAILTLSSCVDVKIASQIPKVTYFSLQKLQTQANDTKCKANKGKIGLLQVSANAPFNDTAIILHNAQTLQISELEHKKWVDSPNKMLESNLLQALEQNCFQVAISPFGTQKLNKILKLSLLGLQVVEDSGKYKAQMSVFYEVLNTSSTQSSKSGIITQEVALQSLEDESFAKNFVKANELVIDKLLKQL